MVKKVNNNMKKLLLLATLAIGIGQTACAHPHYYARPYPVRPVYNYDFAPYYAPPGPVYYNNWNRWDCNPYRRPFYPSPGFGYGFSFNNGRSFGRVWCR